MSRASESDSDDCMTGDSNSEEYTDMSTDEDSNMDHLSVSESVTSGDSVPANVTVPKNKVTMSMQAILKELVEKRKLQGEDEMVLCFSAQDVDADYSNNEDVENFETPTDNLKLFASFLHWYAPGAYEYIREYYITPLPDIKVLAKWCVNEKFQAGFTKQAFDILEKKSAERNRRLICSLVSEEHQLFVHDCFVTIDVGGGELDGDEPYENEGRHAYIILVVSLEENWKIPVGYFLAANTSRETEANVTKMVLHLCHEVGVDIVSITTKRNIAQILGCNLECYKKLTTTFKHPTSGKPVAAFLDSTLSLRSLYHTLNSKKEFFIGHQGKVCMEYIEQMRKLLASKTFQYDFTTVMLELRNMHAKMDLITELMTPSVGAALEVCKNRLKLTQFAGAGPTIEYITMINTLYYILYSKVGQTGYKQPICQENAREILEFLEEARKYISSISYEKPGSKQRQLGVQDPNFLAAGFKELLISIESLKYLYHTLVENGPLDCIPTHRLSWDQMDEFVGVILKHNPRQLGGKFPKIYQTFFEDLKSSLTDCIQFDSYAITSVKKPLDIIKKSSGKRAFDERYSVTGHKRRKTDDEKKANTTVTKYVKHLDTEMDLLKRRQMVGYIAGWMAVQLADTLRCEDCIDTLYSNKKQWFHKLITLNKLGGVCLPSEELFKICCECERSVRRITSLDIAAQRRLLSRILRMAEPSYRSHHIHLTKAIIAKYLRLRLGIDDASKAKKPKAKNPFWLNFLMTNM